MMKRLAIIALIISTLSPVFCRAESVSITQVFEDMKTAGTLTFPSAPNYSAGITDLVTYTGSGGGTFGSDASRICISLPSSTSVMQLSMIEGLEPKARDFRSGPS